MKNNNHHSFWQIYLVKSICQEAAEGIFGILLYLIT